jgi:PAS domain S-box-containing protein
MTQRKDSKNKMTELRRRAESAFAVRPRDAMDTSALSPEEIQKLVHELQVHQIELETQNGELRDTQLALEVSLDNYSDLYNFAPVGYLTLNEKGIVLEANLAAIRLLGVEKKTLINKPLARFVCPEFADAFHFHLREVFETQSKQTREIKLARKDSTDLYARLDSVAVQDENGQLNRCRTVVSDITDSKAADAALIDSKRLLHSTLNTLSNHIALLDENGFIVFVNEAWSHFAKDNNAMLPRDGIGLNYLAICDSAEGDWSEDGPTVARKIRQIIAGELKDFIWEYPCHSPSQRRWFALRATRFLEGNQARVVTSHENITERKEAEEALRKTTRELAERVRELNCLYGLSQLVERSGSSLDKILQGVFELVRPAWQYPEILCARIILDGRELSTENFGDALSKQSADIVALGDRIGCLEVGYVQDRPAADEGPFLKQERDLLDAIAERLGRVAERMKAEQALRASGEKYRCLVEKAPIGILSIDAEGCIREVNKKLLDILGSPSTEATKSINMFTFPPLVKSGLAQVFRRCVEAGEAVTAEIPYTSKWGKTLHLRTILTPMMDPGGNVTGCQAVAEDITERKQAEEEREVYRTQLLQAQKMEAVGTLTGGIAHDFNNLLTIINGYTEMILLDKTQNDPLYSDLQKILETGRKGAEMVQRLQAFTRKVDVCLAPLDLNLTIENLVKLVQRSFSRVIEIETSFANDLGKVNADARQVEQVLLNLFINAQEAMPDGGTIGITTKHVIIDEGYCRRHLGAKPGPHAVVEVTDTGIGMDAGTLSRIFDPFFTTKGWDFKKGTGLGLSVAKGIAEQHGGWITCHSEVGKGTTFSLHFPVIEQESASRKLAPLTETPPGKARILLVDDEEYVRDLGKRFLERAGYAVITAADGLEALEVYAREPQNIALVVLDLITPHVGGKKCLGELVKINPSVKVVVSSGHSLSPQERDHLAITAKGFVDKPYQMKQFLDVVKDVLAMG